MSADIGAAQAGFVNNFAYGTISLTAALRSNWLTSRHNTTSGKPEAVYANELIVPSGATLNLNNLHLYVRGDQIGGTIVGGTVSVVPTGGSIALNTPTPGTLTPAGATDDLDVLRHGGGIDHGAAQSRRWWHEPGDLAVS